MVREPPPGDMEFARLSRRTSSGQGDASDVSDGDDDGDEGSSVMRGAHMRHSTFSPESSLFSNQKVILIGVATFALLLVIVFASTSRALAATSNPLLDPKASECSENSANPQRMSTAEDVDFSDQFHSLDIPSSPGVGRGAQNPSNERTWEVPWVRSVPAVPAAVGGHLRTVLQNQAVLNVSERIAAAPRSVEELVDEEKRRDANVDRLVNKLARDMGAEIVSGDMAGVPIYSIKPAEVAPAFSNRRLVFLHLHGGGYVYGAGLACAQEGVLIAHRAKIEVISVDYRMAPAHPFPAGLEDAVRVYQELLKTHPAANIAVGGTSAGGGLTLAAVQRFKALGLDLPTALFLGSPWADLGKRGDTLFTLEGIDRTLVSYDGHLYRLAKSYVGENDVNDPLISPIYGDFAGFPPAQIVAGTRDMFLSDTCRVHRKFKLAGVEAELNVYEGISHGELVNLARTDESEQAYRELGTFLMKHITT